MRFRDFLGHPWILLRPCWRRDVKSPLVPLRTYCGNYVIYVYSYSHSITLHSCHLLSLSLCLLFLCYFCDLYSRSLCHYFPVILFSSHLCHVFLWNGCFILPHSPTKHPCRMFSLSVCHLLPCYFCHLLQVHLVIYFSVTLVI